MKRGGFRSTSPWIPAHSSALLLRVLRRLTRERLAGESFLLINRIDRGKSSLTVDPVFSCEWDLDRCKSQHTDLPSKQDSRCLSYDGNTTQGTINQDQASQISNSTFYLSRRTTNMQIESPEDKRNVVLHRTRNYTLHTIHTDITMMILVIILVLPVSQDDHDRPDFLAHCNNIHVL